MTTTLGIELIHAHGKDYKVYDGTFYSPDTLDEVIRKLDGIRKTRQRVTLSYGYTSQKQIDETKTDKAVGENWLEEHDVTGTIGRSTGQVKIPLMIHNARSMSGGGILTDCIVRICYAAGGGVIWQHPQYHQPPMTSHNSSTEPGYGAEIRVNGNVHARFKDFAALRRYVHKLRVQAPLES